MIGFIERLFLLQKVVLCDEHGTGGSSEYFGDNDANLDIKNPLGRGSLLK